MNSCALIPRLSRLGMCYRMNSRRCKNSLLSIALILLWAVPVALWSDEAKKPSVDASCTTSDCTETDSTVKPAYTLKIISYGEGTPDSDNMDESALQQNRRVDVTIIAEPEVAENADKVAMPGGGVMWVTKDPLELTRQLEIKSLSRVELQDGQLAAPVRMRLFSNYASYIDRWEVVFFDATDDDMSRPLTKISGDELGYESELEWNGVVDSGDLVQSGDELLYVLRVYDAKGRMDETYPESLIVLGPERNFSSEDEPTLEEIALEARKSRSRLARSEMDIRGSRVRVYGRDLFDARALKINGERVTLDTEQAFATEYLLPLGSHDFDVEITGKDGKEYTKKLSVKLDDEYFFLVALADLTVGKNTVSGAVEKLEVDDDAYYGGDIFVDGRLAFYLKGKIKGKYFVTAQMDTDTKELDDLFTDFGRADPSSVFRRLDPEQYYPVYGDDSTLIDDTDSQGKIFLRVDWDQSRLLWGNFNSGVTGTEFARFNRSLYGAQLQARSQSFTDQGEHVTDVNVFASEAQSAHRHNEFLGTGGSLYYLSDKDIVLGSEKLAVEVRQQGSERVVERIELMQGRDYEIDAFQGRIILNRPLLTVGAQSAPSIVKDTPLDGNRIWLVADYEYVPSTFESSEVTVGGRAKHWFSDHFAFGGTWVVDRREGFDHQIKGIDATVSIAPGTWLRAEIAQSNNTQSAGSFQSTNGGLNFTPFSSNAVATPTEGQAAGVEARIDLSELNDWQRESSLGAWYKQRDSEFSSNTFDTGSDTTDAGFETSIAATDRVTLSARAAVLEKDTISSRRSASAQAEVGVTDRITLAGEYRQIREEDQISDSLGEGSIAALKAGVDVSDNLNIYAAAQRTLKATGDYQQNDLNTVGMKTGQSGRFRFNAELSRGDRGDAALVGSDFEVFQGYSLYLNHSLSTDRTDAVRDTTTLGQRRTLSTKLRVFTEHQFTDDELQAGIGHTFGLDFNPSATTRLNFSYQMSNFENDLEENTDRDALSAGITYKKNRTQLSSRFEYRVDKGTVVDSRQWLTSNNANLQSSPSLRWQIRLNHSETEDRLSGEADARFTEAGLGFALRPWNHDRLNMLGRVTYKYDLPPLSQSTSTDERALVSSLELAYQLNHLWEIGGKLAHKESELRLQRDVGEWIENDALLAAARLRYHLLFKWDALAEYHWLQSDASEDVEHGALVSLGRHVGEHMKLSLGYNFTRFDDNLLNDTIDIGGWFVNLVGKY